MSTPKKFDGSFDGQSLQLARWVAELIAAEPQGARQIHSELDHAEAISLLSDLWEESDDYSGPSKKIH